MIEWKNEKENLKKYLENGENLREIGRKYYNNTSGKTIGRVIRKLGLEKYYKNPTKSIQIDWESKKDIITSSIEKGLSLFKISELPEINTSESTLRRVIKKLGINPHYKTKRPGKSSKYTVKDLIEAVKVSYSYSEVCRRIGLVDVGGNINTVKKKISDLKLDISHFTHKKWSKGKSLRNKNNPLANLLTKNSKYRTNLKDRLLEEGIKERRCECCGQTEHLGKPIPLQLHHIDGDRTNNLISNLQILCPNCHSLTDNFCKPKNSRFPIPSKKEFLENLEKLKYIKEIAKFYKVSQATIRKWIIKLDIREEVNKILNKIKN